MSDELEPRNSRDRFLSSFNNGHITETQSFQPTSSIHYIDDLEEASSSRLASKEEKEGKEKEGKEKEEGAPLCSPESILDDGSKDRASGSLRSGRSRSGKPNVGDISAEIISTDLDMLNSQESILSLPHDGAEPTAPGRQLDKAAEAATAAPSANSNGVVKAQVVEKEPGKLRLAPPKPKCLAPPVSRIPKQNSRKQTSVEDVSSDDLFYHRSLLFEECEKTDQRLKKFMQDAKAENLSVQGDQKFEKVVSFNKKLRLFKSIHDRNKILCQESLREVSVGEESPLTCTEGKADPAQATVVTEPVEKVVEVKEKANQVAQEKSIPVKKNSITDIEKKNTEINHRSEIETKPSVKKSQKPNISKSGDLPKSANDLKSSLDIPKHPHVTSKLAKPNVTNSMIETTFPVESDTPIQNIGPVIESLIVQPVQSKGKQSTENVKVGVNEKIPYQPSKTIENRKTSTNQYQEKNLDFKHFEKNTGDALKSPERHMAKKSTEITFGINSTREKSKTPTSPTFSISNIDKDIKKDKEGPLKEIIPEYSFTQLKHRPMTNPVINEPAVRKSEPKITYNDEYSKGASTHDKNAVYETNNVIKVAEITDIGVESCKPGEAKTNNLFDENVKKLREEKENVEIKKPVVIVSEERVDYRRKAKSHSIENDNVEETSIIEQYFRKKAQRRSMNLEESRLNANTKSDVGTNKQISDKYSSITKQDAKEESKIKTKEYDFNHSILLDPTEIKKTDNISISEALKATQKDKIFGDIDINPRSSKSVVFSENVRKSGFDISDQNRPKTALLTDPRKEDVNEFGSLKITEKNVSWSINEKNNATKEKDDGKPESNLITCESKAAKLSISDHFPKAAKVEDARSEGLTKDQSYLSDRSSKILEKIYRGSTSKETREKDRTDTSLTATETDRNKTNIYSDKIFQKSESSKINDVEKSTFGLFKSGFLLAGNANPAKTYKHETAAANDDKPAVEPLDKFKANKNVQDSVKGQGLLKETPDFHTSNKKYKETLENVDNNNYVPSSEMNYTDSTKVRNELDLISKQKTEIEKELKKLSNENLKRLLHVSPSPEEFSMTDKLYMLEAEVDTISLHTSLNQGKGLKSLEAELLDVEKSEKLLSAMFFPISDPEGQADRIEDPPKKKRFEVERVENFRQRRKSGPASPDDVSLNSFSDKSFDSDEDRLRQRRRSGPTSLKPVLRSTGAATTSDAQSIFPIKKSVTFSTAKLTSTASESNKATKPSLQRRNTMERISLQKVGSDTEKLSGHGSVKEMAKNWPNIPKEDGLKSRGKDIKKLSSSLEGLDSTTDTRVELEEIIKQKEEIETKLKMMNEKNLQRLLHISPSPEALPETEKLTDDDLGLETMLRPLILSSAGQPVLGPHGHAVPWAVRGHMQRMARPRSPFPSPVMQGKMRFRPRTIPPVTPGQTRMSPPLRPLPMYLFRTPSPTAGLVRVTPRHLPPSYRMNGPRLGSPSPRQPHPRFSPVISPRSPLRKMRCSGQFSPIRPPHFRPPYYMIGPRSPRPLPPSVRPHHHSPFRYPRPPVSGYQTAPATAFSAVDSAAEHRKSASTSAAAAAGAAAGVKPIQPVKPIKSSQGQPIKADIRDIKHVTMNSNNEKIIQVRGYGTVKITTPEVATISCSDLLTAYRMSQTLTGARPYKYDPNESIDLHRRLTINSRKIFEKLSSPRKEKKGPYVPNREVLRLFRNDQRGREQVAMENEEMLYHHKTSNERQGEFFVPKNSELLEKFQATHEYIRKLYIHSKSSIIPPGDELADVHERVKYFCGVTNEDLLEKLRSVEERVRNTEWFSRVQDTKERMSTLYNENREFLEKFKASQERKVNDLLDENKELIDNLKEKVNTIDKSVKDNINSLDQMVEAAVIEVI